MKDHKEKLRKQSHLPLHQKGINLHNEAKDPYAENDNIQKKIKDDTSRRRYITCFGIRRIYIVKMTILPKAICRLSAVPLKL